MKTDTTITHPFIKWALQNEGFQLTEFEANKFQQLWDMWIGTLPDKPKGDFYQSFRNDLYEHLHDIAFKPENELYIVNKIAVYTQEAFEDFKDRHIVVDRSPHNVYPATPDECLKPINPDGR